MYLLMLTGIARMSLGGVTQCPVKELVQQTKQLKLPIDVDHAIQQPSALQKIPQMLLRHHNRPAKIRERNSLGCALGADFTVALFNICLGLVQQPVAQVQEYLCGAFAQFVRRNLVKIGRAGRSSELAEQSSRQFLAVGFNQRTKRSAIILPPYLLDV